VFPRLIDLTEGDPLKQGYGRRCGEWERSVGTVDVARTLDERAAGELLQVQGLESCAGADNISDGILGPDLMEADAFGGYSMDSTLRHGDPLENRESTFFDAGGQGTSLQQFSDLRMVPAMGVIMIVGMVLLVGMLPMIMGVAVIMLMMPGRLPLDFIVSSDPEAPSGNPSSVSPFKLTFGKGDGK